MMSQLFQMCESTKSVWKTGKLFTSDIWHLTSRFLKKIEGEKFNIYNILYILKIIINNFLILLSVSNSENTKIVNVKCQMSKVNSLLSRKINRIILWYEKKLLSLHPERLQPRRRLGNWNPFHCARLARGLSFDNQIQKTKE